MLSELSAFFSTSESVALDEVELAVTPTVLLELSPIFSTVEVDWVDAGLVDDPMLLSELSAVCSTAGFIVGVKALLVDASTLPLVFSPVFSTVETVDWVEPENAVDDFKKPSFISLACTLDTSRLVLQFVSSGLDWFEAQPGTRARIKTTVPSKRDGPIIIAYGASLWEGITDCSTYLPSNQPAGEMLSAEAKEFSSHSSCVMFTCKFEI